MNLRSAMRGWNHESRRSGAQPLWSAGQVARSNSSCNGREVCRRCRPAPEQQAATWGPARTCSTCPESPSSITSTPSPARPGNHALLGPVTGRGVGASRRGRIVCGGRLRSACRALVLGRQIAAAIARHRWPGGKDLVGAGAAEAHRAGPCTGTPRLPVKPPHKLDT